jgi:Mg-chelatase subunit ChlD
MSILRPYALAACAVGLVTIACGGVGCGSSGGDSTFGDPNGGLLGDGGQNGSSGGLLGSSGSSGNPGGVTPGSACATSSAGANGLPVYLVFMVDKSGSMADNSKWPSATSALDNFFGSATSTGLHASIQFFKQNDECNPAVYAAPAVPMTALPAGPTFQTVIAQNSPNGGTPTIAAEKGAILYAQQVQPTLKPGEKVVIVLVTDGDPNDCAANPKNVVGAAAEVAAAAATVASTIPTYVIGVGPDAQNLNAIAVGGGTGAAIMVATNNPAQTTADLQKAIGQVRQSALGCDYTLPAPPAGQTLDINSVNVNYTPPGGQPQTLTYSKDCADPNGWHYDNPTTPTLIQMCPGICNTLKTTGAQGAKVDVVFGCKTQGGVTK